MWALTAAHHSTTPPLPQSHAQVLENQELIDKTLLFNVKLVRVDAADGNGGFTTVR